MLSRINLGEDSMGYFETFIERYIFRERLALAVNDLVLRDIADMQLVGTNPQRSRFCLALSGSRVVYDFGWCDW